MAKIIEDAMKVIEEGGKKYFIASYKEEISAEDIKKRRSFIQKNIDALKANIKAIDIPKLIEKEEKKIDNERAIQRESLLHFDKYIQEMLDDIRKNKAKTRQDIKTYLVNFDRYKAKKLMMLRAQQENLLVNYKSQLVNDEKQIHIYKTEDSEKELNPSSTTSGDNEKRAE